MVIARPLFISVMWLVSLVLSLFGAVGAHRSRSGSVAVVAWVLLALTLASPIFLAVIVAAWLMFLV
ncbi:hypothetical protein [Actinomyces urogenitalis]|uniref:hypothetical protein n=1 Tax=Actinomyces urogenitalis TaxID=103621 RepID=UPI00242E54DA|nr:hypothetical protein [Actinomyces urogenitalis]MCI7456360.1 hypothetical protein [Actinomyces urogenitalis]